MTAQTSLRPHDLTHGRRADEFGLRRLLGGWHPRAAALAMGVSERTAYRWRAEVERLERVELAGYVATFAIRRGKPPVRVSKWVAR